MDHSCYAQISYGSDDELEDDAQSVMPYYYDAEDDCETIEGNNDEYWDVYFDADD